MGAKDPLRDPSQNSDGPPHRPVVSDSMDLSANQAARKRGIVVVRLIPRCGAVAPVKHPI
jgi:hypothetical protein